MKPLLALLLAVPASAYGFVTWIASADAIDDRAHGFGWSSPEMAPHWSRLWSDWRILHNLKNITTEWTRLSAQRASKAFSFLAVAGWLVVAAMMVF